MAGCRCDHGTIIVDPGNPTNACEDCLYVTSHILACDDGLLPCGDNDDIVLETNCDNPTFTIIYADPVFTNVAISQVEDQWVLTFDSSEAAVGDDSYHEISYKMSCSGGDFDGLTVIGTATICISDPCRDVTCEGDEVCDACGVCGPAEINLGLNIA